MKLICHTSEAPLTDPVDIGVTGLAPGSRVTVSLTLTDEVGVEWRSEAMFQADTMGSVHSSTHPSLRGNYRGVDPHGLFWSAQPDRFESLVEDILAGQERTLMPVLDPLADLKWVVRAETDNGASKTATIMRQRVTKGVRQVSPPSPLQGLIFEPELWNGASVLVLGGSEGGLFPSRAALLAEAGFRTFALAYFQYPGSPDEGRDLPLEYFAKALSYLKETGDGRVGLIGISRGSEAAQLTTLKWPDLVDALVLWVPSHMINRGLDLAGGDDFQAEISAMWSYSGKPIPGVGFLEQDIEASKTANEAFATPYGRRYCEEFLRAWHAAPDAMRIPIEQYQGPVLSVAGAQDALWPSAYGAERITTARAAETGPREIVIYENAGHLIGTPNEPRPIPWLMHWSDGYMGIENGFCAYGGTREGAALAARQSWQTKTNFLLQTLC
ncbi:MAG: acyl-CoA thioesterase/bile acid-CoA:amino acid N-acyltransferase family protein [Pseudomonadota bacterium]